MFQMFFSLGYIYTVIDTQYKFLDSKYMVIISFYQEYVKPYTAER